MVAPVGALEVSAIMRTPMIDSGAHSSVCPPSYGATEPTTSLEADMQLVTVTGADITLHGRRIVPSRATTVNGEVVEEKVKYVVADVRKPIRAVADILDSGQEVHFGETSWIARHAVQVPPDAILLERHGNQFFVPYEIDCPMMGPMDPANPGDAAEPVPDGEAGEKAPEADAKREAIEVRRVEEPSAEARRVHALTHIPYAAWCIFCVMGRAQDDPHVRQPGRLEALLVLIAMDYGFIDGDGAEERECLPFLSIMDTGSGSIGAIAVRRKGLDEYSVKAVMSFLEELGYLKIEIQTDGEPAILALAKNIRQAAGASGDMDSISLRRSPVHSHASNGAAEVAVKIVKGLLRTIIVATAKAYDVPIKLKSAILPWALRHAAFTYNRFQVLKSGRTPFEQLKLTKFNATMMEFGECVLAKKPTPPSSTLDPLWSEGVWLGRSTTSGDHLVGTPTGVIQARAVKPLDPARRWDKQLLQAMVWSPWMPNEKDEAVPPDGEGWTPTEGCKACEEDAEPVRRRGRPRGHTPACLQRRAERRMAAPMQAAPQALMPINTEPRPAVQPANPGQAEEGGDQAAASSSSGGEPQPRHRITGKRALPDMLPEDAKKARVDAEMLIGTFDKVKVEVNEEEIPNVKMNDKLTPEVESVIKHEELERLDEFRAYDAVPRADALTKILTLTWVMEQRSGEWRARLCARPFGKAPRPKDELYTPTPFPSTIRALLVYAHLNGLAVRFFDVRRAFLHTPIRDDVWIEPPPEWPNPRDEVWKLRCTLYGLQEAMVDFDTYFDEVVQGKVNYEGYPVMTMNRNLTDPASWRGEKVLMAKHVDDGIVVGRSHDIDQALDKLGSYFILKITEEISVGREEKLLGSLIKRTEDGFTQECLPSHIDKYLKILNMETASSVSTPGEKNDAKRLDEPELDAQEAETFRSAVGLALFFVQFRPECLYAVKECSRGMRQPSTGDMRRAKRLARYFRGSRGVVLKLAPSFEDIQKITCACDSDWAKDTIGRKSTSGVAVFWAGALITAFARTQGTVALSAAEAESYAMCSGAAEGLGLRSLLIEMGIQVEIALEINSDSSAAISGMSRLGLGKLMKHVQTKYLFLQELVRDKLIILVKIDTKLNVADVLTKNVTREILERHKRAMGLWIPPTIRGEVSAAYRMEPGMKQVISGVRVCLMGALTLIDRADARSMELAVITQQGIVDYVETTIHSNYSYIKMMVTLLMITQAVLTMNYVTYKVTRWSLRRAAVRMQEAAVQTEPENLNHYTVEALKDELRYFDLSTRGTKQEVMERVARLRAGAGVRCYRAL